MPLPQITIFFFLAQTKRERYSVWIFMAQISISKHAQNFYNYNNGARDVTHRKIEYEVFVVLCVSTGKKEKKSSKKNRQVKPSWSFRVNTRLSTKTFTHALIQSEEDLTLLPSLSPLPVLSLQSFRSFSTFLPSITMINSTYSTFFLPHICYQLAMRSQDKATPAVYSIWTSTNVEVKEEKKLITRNTNASIR